MSSDQTKTELIEQIKSLRTDLLALLEKLAETRLTRPTTRQGWTLRHEICWLVAADEELRQRLEIVAGNITEEPLWRRVRGVAMHKAQELRMAALSEQLDISGTSLSASLKPHFEHLDDPTIQSAIQSHNADGTRAINTLRTELTN